MGREREKDREQALLFRLIIKELQSIFFSKVYPSWFFCRVTFKKWIIYRAHNSTIK